MTALIVKTFDGLKPISHPRLLGQSESQVAQNVRLISGALNPLRASTILKATTLASPKTIFRYGNSNTETDYWLEFNKDTDVMRSPIAQDQWDRLYWTDGDNIPKYAPNTMVLSGSPMPGAGYDLGIPAPSTKITYGSYSTAPVYTIVTREYCLTLYNPTTDSESPPGTTFTVQGVDGQKVTLTSLTTNNGGDSGVTKKRLYRRVSGTFRRVAELDIAATTYEDSATDASLASAPALPATTNVPSAPTTAPIVSAPYVSGTDPASSRQYVYTILNASYGTGEGYVFTYETNASPPVTISADSTQTVTISGLSNSTGEGFVGTHFRVYRKDADSSQYLFVAEFPVSQTSVEDPIGTTVLGIPLSSAIFGGTISTTPTATATASTASSTIQVIYTVTYVDGSNVEGAHGPSSSAVRIIDGQTEVTITHSETVPSGYAKKRIYRQTLGSGGSTNEANWRLVAEVTASTTSYLDSAASSTLTTAMSSTIQNLPPSPTGTPGLTATIPPTVIPEARTYVYTFVSAYGEEGPPSDASEVIEVDPSGSVTVTMGGPAAGNYNLSLKRIYRSSSAGPKAYWQFVAEVPVAQTSYTDSLSQDELGEVLPSEEWVAPPAGLKGLRLMANGAAVGFKGKTVYFSEPNLPHAWPHEYPIDEEIVGIGVFGQSVAVLTKGYPYLFSGIDPAAMASTKLRVPQACVSKRSIVETGDGVVYASPDGFMSIGANVGLLTASMMSRDNWQAYKPESMEAYIYNGRVILFYDTGSAKGTLLFDLSGQGAVLTTADINSTSAISAGYYDARTDTLYLAQGGNIVRFDRGSNLTATWKSKVWRLPAQDNFGFAQVRAAAYPVTLKVWADGVLKHTQTVTSERQFRLPAGFRALEWEFQIESSNEVTEVFLTQSSAELRAA